MTSDSFSGFVNGQFAELDSLRSRRMFGGHGLYLGDVFFGLIFDDRLYFKTDDGTRKKYEARHMAVFQPNERQTLKRYFEVPVDVVEQPAMLIQWAREAAATA